MTSPAEHFRRQYDAVAAHLPGAELAWLRASRQAALEQFAVEGFPSPRLEDWKYTRLAAISKQPFQSAVNGNAGTTTMIPENLRVPETSQMVFVDGRYRQDLSLPAAPTAGIRIRPLGQALAQSPDQLQRLLDPGPSFQRHGFNALNSAFAGDGLIIELDANQTLEQPLQLLFYNSPEADRRLMLHPRVVVSLAANARLRLIETHGGQGSGVYLNNCATLIQLGDGARLDHYKLQCEAPGAFHISSLDVRQDRDSRFISHSVSLGAAISRHEIQVALDGPGADCLLNGLYLGKDRQYVDYHTRIDHHASHCTSNEDYKGVLGGSAQGVFNGRVYVHPDAQKTDARQSNRNLLLSPTAEVDTKPQLEIYADDVKCAHGATTGQLDETMVFYLRSRGIPEAGARALLTYGFARDIVDRMDLQQLREAVAQALLEGMPVSDDLRSMIS